MKKIISLLLAMIMVFSLATVAAAVVPVDPDMSTITFTKTYNAVGTGAVSPEEIFEFENITFTGATETGVGYTGTWAEANLPTISTVSFEKGDAGKEGEMIGTVTVTLPTNYPSVGIYTYSFNEKNNMVEGVTYNNTTMKLVVTVIEENGLNRVAAVHCEGVNGTPATKTGNFDNTYSAGKLSVSKTVTGNLGDLNKYFDVTVTFTAEANKTVNSDITYTGGQYTTDQTITGGWTGSKSQTISLKHGDTINFSNIPAGVTYTVVEADYTTEAGGKYDAAVYAFSDTGKLISANDADTVGITNNKSTVVDTGIALDSAPYFVILAVAMFGMVALVSKKRYEV